MADPTGIIVNIAIQAAIAYAIYLLTPKTVNEGPRLDDTNVTTSTYGQEIPIGYGTVILNGNIIWATDLEEVKRTETPGKGGPKVENITYQYFATFACALARRELTEVLRIYADGKLIFDSELSDINEIQTRYQKDRALYTGVITQGEFEELNEQDDVNFIDGLEFRVYSGSQDQLPDFRIEEDVGSGNAPAYRGTAYVLFDRLPLESFGNRIPQLRFVCDFSNRQTGLANINFDSNEFDPYSNTASISLAGDPDKGSYVIRQKDPSGDWYQEVYEAGTNNLLASFPSSTTGMPNTSADPIGGPSGPFIAVKRGEDSAARVSVLDTRTGLIFGATSVTDLVGERASMYAEDTDGDGIADAIYFQAGRMTWAEVTTAGRTVYFLVGGHSGYPTQLTGATFGALRCDPAKIADPDRPYETYLEYVGDRQVGGFFNPPNGDADSGIQSVMMGPKAEGVTAIFTVVALAQTSSGAYRTNDHTAEIRVYFLTEQRGVGYYTAYRALASFPGGRTGYLHYDKTRRILLYEADGVDTTPKRATAYRVPETEDGDVRELIELWSVEGDEMLWEVETTLGRSSTRGGETYGKGILVRMSQTNDVIYKIDIETGKVLESQSSFLSQWSAGDQGFPVSGTTLESNYHYDERTDSLMGALANYRLTPPKVRNPETLQTVVEDITLRSKLEEADIDASALATKNVRGYTISQSTSFRGALEPLATAFDFYAVEKAGQIVFDFNNSATTKTIADDDLLQSNRRTFLEEVRGQEEETPRAIYVVHLDPAEDDKKGVQVARRTSDPVKAMNSVAEERVELAVHLTPAEALEIAERLLYDTWVKRERLKFRLPPRYLDILPNDVVRFTAAGRTDDVRVEKLTIGADLKMELEGSVVDGEVYTREVQREAPTNVITRGIDRKRNLRKASNIIGWVLDTPMLLDGQLPDRTRGIVYYAAARTPGDAGRFNGASLYTRYGSASTFDFRTATNAEAPYAQLVDDTFPDIPHVDFNGVQEVSVQFQIMQGDDQFASVTQDNMIQNNQNFAVLLRPRSNKVELVNYRTVDEDSNGFVTITGWMRGRRGTNSEAFYDAQEAVYLIPLSTTWVTGFFEQIARNDQTVTYRSYPSGIVAPQVFDESQTLNLRSLMPYEPADVKLYQSSDLDLDIGWTRRTRLNGDLLNNTGAIPLAEDDESYEVDILDNANGDNVLRTLTASGPGVTYTFAQAVEDFGTSGYPDVLYVRVYQMSGSVGRGFSSIRGLTVAEAI